MKTSLKQTMMAGVLATMVGSAIAAPAQAPSDFIKTVADSLIGKLKA